MQKRFALHEEMEFEAQFVQAVLESMTCEYQGGAVHLGVVRVCEGVLGFLTLRPALRLYFATAPALGLTFVCFYYQQAMLLSFTQTVCTHTVWLV